MSEQEYEWYGHVTRRRRKRSQFWDNFWGVFMLLNLVAVVIFVGVVVWASFDIENRVGYMLAAQVPPIVMMAVRRLFQ